MKSEFNERYEALRDDLIDLAADTESDEARFTLSQTLRLMREMKEHMEFNNISM